MRRRTHRTIRVATVTAALGLALAACGSADSEPAADTAPLATEAATTPEPTVTEPDKAPADAAPPVTDPPTEAPVDTPAPAVVPEALQFTAPLVGGGELDARTLAGLPTALWFWAPT